MFEQQYFSLTSRGCTVRTRVTYCFLLECLNIAGNVPMHEKVYRLELILKFRD